MSVHSEVPPQLLPANKLCFFLTKVDFWIWWLHSGCLMTVVLTWPCAYRETTLVTQSVTVLHLCLRHNPNTHLVCGCLPGAPNLVLHGSVTCCFNWYHWLRHFCPAGWEGHGRAPALLSASSQGRKGKQHTPREVPRRHSFSWWPALQVFNLFLKQGHWSIHEDSALMAQSAPLDPIFQYQLTDQGFNISIWGLHPKYRKYSGLEFVLSWNKIILKRDSMKTATVEKSHYPESTPNQE